MNKIKTIWNKYLELPTFDKILILTIFNLALFIGEYYYAELWRNILNFPHSQSIYSQMGDLAPLAVTTISFVFTYCISFPEQENEDKK